MLDPTTLFSYERDVEPRTIDASTLVVTLGAFADSGHVQKLLNSYIADTTSTRVLGTFDADQIIDYTGIRPPVTLDADHFTGYEKPRIELLHVTPGEGKPFLLLQGPEPNFQWERTAAAVRIVIEQLGVTRTLIASGFPAATPHTRPVPVTRFAGDPKDLVISSPLLGSVDMRASFTTLLTIRLAESRHSVIGLAAHIPSYAHEMDYHPALAALLTGLRSEGGPDLPETDALSEAIAQTRLTLDAAAGNNEQLGAMIEGFEENYSKMDGLIRTITASDASPIPGAENLTDEVEEFLRDVSQGPSTTPEHFNDSPEPSANAPEGRTELPDDPEGPSDSPTAPGADH